MKQKSGVRVGQKIDHIDYGRGTIEEIRDDSIYASFSCIDGYEQCFFDEFEVIDDAQFSKKNSIFFSRRNGSPSGPFSSSPSSSLTHSNRFDVKAEKAERTEKTSFVDKTPTVRQISAPPSDAAYSNNQLIAADDHKVIKGMADSPVGSKGLDTGKLGKMRPCGVLSDVPPKWCPTPSHKINLKTPKNPTNKDVYRIAMEALINEMRKRGAGAKKITVENGVPIKLDGVDNSYKFSFDGDQELFEGAALRAFVGGQQSEGKIVSVSGKEIFLTLDRSFGSLIPEAILQVDNTAMLEALVQRFKELDEGKGPNFNVKLADAVIENSGKESSSAALLHSVQTKTAHHRLNMKQTEAVSMALANEITYLWGPPGTGKTRSLGALIELLFGLQKRVLICSNTNQAVDQVLLKLCQLFGKSHPALDKGKILRIGKIHHQELQDEYHSYVNIDGVIERKSKILIDERQKIETKLLELQKELAGSRETIKLFEKLKKAEDAQQQVVKHIEKTTLLIRTYETKLEKLQIRDGRIHEELSSLLTAGPFRRLFKRSENTIKNDLRSIQVKTEELHSNISSTFELLQEYKSQTLSAEQSVNEFKQRLTGKDLKIEEQLLKEGENKIVPLNSRMSEITKQLDVMAKSVMENAQIIGATVTKGYLSAQQFSNFDVVIVDEASMVMLPALYYVCGLAKEKVIISGDFLQLAPIVPSYEKQVIDYIGKDIFDAAGITEAFFNNKKLPRTVMLDTQFRMSEAICFLISKWMYLDKLHTGTSGGNKEGLNPPEPYDAELIIIDTSTIMPFVNRDAFGSRYNLMHGMITRNLCRFFTKKGFGRDEHGQVGICTPYASQAKLHNRILEGCNLTKMIEAGTIHRYQGDEKKLMIIDIPDSIGEYRVGVFLQADSPQDNGAKLFNVAVSRAKQHLVFIANLAYLDKKLPQNSFVRYILHDIQERGRVIDSRDVLALWPIKEELAKLGMPFELAPETLKDGLFSHKDFHKVFMADLAKVQKSILIFSGFFTPKRVGAYAELFRGKLSEGVRIRCVTRPPHHNGSMDEAEGRDTLDALEQLGVVVDTRWDIHEKVAILDDHIVWFGSLNPLSHTCGTSEVMARLESPEAAKQLTEFLTLNQGVKKEAEKGYSLSTLKENPKCETCGRRATLRKGRYGLYWECEGKCGWTANLGSKGKDKTQRSGSQNPLKGQPAPTCDKCGKIMRPKEGRFGPFWGCSGYPECKFTKQPAKRKTQ